MIKPTLWNCIMMYRYEATNPKHNFSQETQDELLRLMDIAERHHESLNPMKLDKTHRALTQYDRTFDAANGSMEYLEGKVNEIIGEKNSKRIGYILKAGQKLKSVRKGFRRNIK